ncbi:hypothetical protein NO2_0710 [Candidatus Termititenax persephonae]|uniref:Peptidase S8/S53 domain-containing protein n=1 Tax=Candidatus Termititenax persephonae TaxID=2218525 RepID=A0A388TG95_9BACT|nr:hypothetical protein NO2_0710 [Candidatus Termititenax persephonae]
MSANKLRHLELSMGHINATQFSLKQGGGSRLNIPHRLNRKTHAQKLRHQLEEIRNTHDNDSVFAIKFSGQANMDFLFEELDKSAYKMELLSIKKVDGVISANVRVDSTITFDKLSSALQNYVNPKPRNGKEVQNPLPYIASIERIERVSIDSFFTDDISLLPMDNNPHWWEVWLTNKTKLSVRDLFIKTAIHEGLSVNRKPISFYDRTIFLCEATKEKLSAFVQKCNVIAEIRIAKKAKTAIVNSTYAEQESLMDSLLKKTTYPHNNNTRIVVLDGNYIVRHPLLSNALIRNQQADYRFSLDNQDEHATEIGGLALFGNIAVARQYETIVLRHKIEGVQVLDGILDFPELYGRITESAVQITNDNTNSAYIMPVSETFGDKHKGKPSSWSACMDRITFERQKLFAASVGNVNGIIKSNNYEQEQRNSCIESPAQAWNILSVGSYTQLCDANLGGIQGVIPYANAGDISPHSRTSCLFESQWPIKPEVLFEGGNKIVAANGEVMTHDAFDLVSCAKDFRTKLFTNIYGTSASVGLAGQFIGELMAEYPAFWPETIRGLIVHSATWTESMVAKRPNPYTKKDIMNLSRIFGHGVPDLEKAKYSASNALTLIAQKDFQVFAFKLDENDVPTKEKTSQILIFPLPWPIDVLQGELHDKLIKLKITLSYFIKPNPSERGYSTKYAYQSHNLRFDIQRPTETKEDFERRINNAIDIEENENNENSKVRLIHQDNLNWFYGAKSNSRTKGSIHKDVLEITGAQLATMQNIAIYSVAGWWKHRKTISADDTRTRFSLIIDIDAGDIDIDLYTQIQTLIPNLITI